MSGGQVALQGLPWDVLHDGAQVVADWFNEPGNEAGQTNHSPVYVHTTQVPLCAIMALDTCLSRVWVHTNPLNTTQGRVLATPRNPPVQGVHEVRVAHVCQALHGRPRLPVPQPPQSNR